MGAHTTLDEMSGLGRGSGAAGFSAGPGRQVREGGGADDPGVATAGMVHDLNNALTVVLASLEQLGRQPLDGQGRRQLDRAQWGARQAARLARRMIASSPGEGSTGPWT